MRVASPPAPASCSASDFDNGAWLRSSRAELFGIWRCPFWDDGVRFDCTNRVPYRRWSTACEVPNAHDDVLSANGGRRTIFFVGDSIAEQHYRVVACRVLHDAARRNVRTLLTSHGSTGGVPMRKCNSSGISCIGLPSWVELLPDQPTRDARCAPHCSTVSTTHWTVTLCYIAAGTAYPACSRRASDTASSLLGMRIARRGDVVILNEGIWHNDVARSAANLASLHTELTRGKSSLQSAFAQHDIGLVWRETAPQHFNGSATGSFLGWPDKKSAGGVNFYHGSGCAPNAAVDEQKRRRAPLLDALEDAGLPVLRIWRLTASQWDAHLDMRTPFITRPAGHHGADCTHFCDPSGVLEAWADGSLILLQRVLRNLNGSW